MKRAFPCGGISRAGTLAALREPERLSKPQVDGRRLHTRSDRAAGHRDPSRENSFRRPVPILP
jgi:hypothetical protein